MPPTRDGVLSNKKCIGGSLGQYKRRAIWLAALGGKGQSKMVAAGIVRASKPELAPANAGQHFRGGGGEDIRVWAACRQTQQHFDWGGGCQACRSQAASRVDLHPKRTCPRYQQLSQGCSRRGLPHACSSWHRDPRLSRSSGLRMPAPARTELSTAYEKPSKASRDLDPSCTACRLLPSKLLRKHVYLSSPGRPSAP